MQKVRRSARFVLRIGSIVLKFTGSAIPTEEIVSTNGKKIGDAMVAEIGEGMDTDIAIESKVAEKLTGDNIASSFTINRQSRKLCSSFS